MEFTPITTQEAFDAAIKDRLARERETVTKKFADYDDLKNRELYCRCPFTVQECY